MELFGDPEGYFRSLVGSRLDEPVLGYVVSLLTDFLRISPSGEPLCLRLGDLSPRRVLVLKEVGDEALFVSGFLLGPEPRYYAGIGATAYGELSERVRDPLFRLLASDFVEVQEALRDARRDCETGRTDHLLLVREWLRGEGESLWQGSVRSVARSPS